MTENERKRRNRRTGWLLGVLLTVTVLFIWGNSMQNGTASGETSGFVRSLLESLLGVPIDEFLLRKAAHFSEYALLGAESAVLLNLLRGADNRPLARGRNLLDVPALGILTALIDETIQIFTGRGPMVADVWIDTAGFLTGFFLTVLVFRLCRIHSRKERTTHP